MELQQTTINKLMQLFLNNDIEESDEPDDIIDTVIELHNEYIEDEEALLTALRLERDRLTYNSRLNYAEEVGIEKGFTKGIEQGIAKEKRENVLKMFKKFYPKGDTTFLDNLTLEQYNSIFDMLLNNESLENIYKYVKK